MAYRITYGENNIQKQYGRKKIKWKPVVVGTLALMLAVTLCIPAGRLWLRDLVLPGDEEITAGALENLAEDLENGVSLGDAMDAFCYEIIHGQEE